MSTLENIALAQAQKQFPSNPFQRKGFMAALRTDPDWENYTDYGTTKVETLVPDAWFKDTWHPGLLNPGLDVWFTAIEIEDQHFMSHHKLYWYAQLWDCYHCAFTLFVFDRYGMNKREISLRDYY